MQITTLTKSVEIIQNNFIEFKKAYPILFSASEAINQGFDVLLSEEINKDKDGFLAKTIYTMLFGSHVAWINSYIFTSAGYKSSGLVELRRAIEFVCYAAKISDSKKRAKLWIDQRDNEEARRDFSLQCSIPAKYNSEKYKFLRPLLVIHEEASYYGAHGNFESIIYNYTEKENGEIHFHYQMNKKYVPNSVGEIIIVGYRLLQAYNHIFKKYNYFTDNTKFSDVLEFIKEDVQKARIELAKREFNGIIPKQIFENIKQDNQEEINRLFFEMIKKYEE